MATNPNDYDLNDLMLNMICGDDEYQYDEDFNAQPQNDDGSQYLNLGQDNRELENLGEDDNAGEV